MNPNRLAIVVVFAALMGATGMFLIGLSDSKHFTGGIFLSIAMWAGAAFVLKGNTASSAIAFGAASPFIGGLLLGGFSGFGYALISFFISMPIGMFTGFFVYLIVSDSLSEVA